MNLRILQLSPGGLVTNKCRFYTNFLFYRGKILTLLSDFHYWTFICIVQYYIFRHGNNYFLMKDMANGEWDIISHYLKDIQWWDNIDFVIRIHNPFLITYVIVNQKNPQNCDEQKSARTFLSIYFNLI